MSATSLPFNLAELPRESGLSPYIALWSGKPFHLAEEPSSVDWANVSVWDIAWSLAGVMRYASHTPIGESVAVHTLALAAWGFRLGLPPSARLALLVHDGQEAPLGDQTSPYKKRVPQAQRYDELQMGAMLRYMGLEEVMASWSGVVHTLDKCISTYEKAMLWAVDLDKTNYRQLHEYVRQTDRVWCPPDGLVGLFAPRAVVAHHWVNTFKALSQASCLEIKVPLYPSGLAALPEHLHPSTSPLRNLDPSALAVI